jgi:NitT/TauT family transport system permease protein
VLVHSVLWAVALNTHAGFRSVSTTHRMVGQNYGLRGIGFVTKILFPRRFQHSGRPQNRLGVRLAHVDRRELVFGTTSGQGGLGWYIFEAKNQLNIPRFLLDCFRSFSSVFLSKTSCSD